MSVQERILTIRLMEKVRSHPEFAERLGISLAGKSAGDAGKGKG